MENAVRFLVIGAGGLIGQAVAEEIGSKYVWKGTYYLRAKPNYLKCNIMDAINVEEVFDIIKPTHVIHCAQLAGGVDFYERNPNLAKKFHFDATTNIGKQCIKYKAKFLFISSECVFDGKRESCNENDALNPLNVYGKYKAKSEGWIQKNLKDYIIVRTMSVYGWDPFTVTPNAVMRLYFSISKGNKVFVPVFRWGTPTYVKDLARALLELSLSKESGLFHVAGTTFISRYEWLRTTSDVLGWDASLVLPLERISEGIAPRPNKINLDTDKFCERFKTKLHSLQEGLECLKEDFLTYNQNARHARVCK
jgi:dTDP-4-dehydrorhamnose reductase